MPATSERDQRGRFQPGHAIGAAHRFQPGQPSPNPEGRPWGLNKWMLTASSSCGAATRVMRPRFSMRQFTPPLRQARSRTRGRHHRGCRAGRSRTAGRPLAEFPQHAAGAPVRDRCHVCMKMGPWGLSFPVLLNWEMHRGGLSNHRRPRTRRRCRDGRRRTWPRERRRARPLVRRQPPRCATRMTT